MTAQELATPAETELTELSRLVARGGVVVLSGAGLSTESGIPDYRGPTGAARRHSPMTYQAFLKDPLARHRYWARSHVGWQHFAGAQPNDGHRVVADLERAGLITGTITQNVDGLHQAAGSQRVIDLHGRLDRVVCLSCGQTSPRAALNSQLAAANASWQSSVTRLNPDGDAELADEDLDGFAMLDCDACGGVLKPDVVYFGENVPVDRVADAIALVEGASALLVLGSSLIVFSGRRFVVRAARNGTPIAIVNDGPTRCDDLAALRVNDRLGPTLSRLGRQCR